MRQQLTVLGKSRKAWFELASIRMILADSASTKRVHFVASEEPIELTIEQLIGPNAPLRISMARSIASQMAI
jgi:hypothetical protein